MVYAVEIYIDGRIDDFFDEPYAAEVIFDPFNAKSRVGGKGDGNLSALFEIVGAFSSNLYLHDFQFIIRIRR